MSGRHREVGDPVKLSKHIAIVSAELMAEFEELGRAARELEAAVSKLTQERDEAREVVRHVSIVSPIPALVRAVAKWDAPGPKWIADSARLGVTEAEVLKDLEKR